MSLQRADIRAKYNLEGSCLVDIAASCCCALCVLTQDEKEVKARDAAGQGSPGVMQQYQAPEGMAYPAAAPATATAAPAGPPAAPVPQ